METAADSGASSPGAGSRTNRSVASGNVDLKNEGKVEREWMKILVSGTGDEAG